MRTCPVSTVLGMPRTREDIQAQGHDGYDIDEAASDATEHPETNLEMEWRLVLELAGVS